MKSQPSRTKVRAASAIALLVCALLLPACTPTGTPTPNPDHGNPASIAPTVAVEIRFGVASINEAPAERYVIGEAKMIDKQGKVMLGRDQKTGREYPLVTPFKVLTYDGEAFVQISYTPGTALYIDVSGHLQGRGGDTMHMEITNRDTGRLLPLAAGGLELCRVDKPPTEKGVCTTTAKVLVTV